MLSIILILLTWQNTEPLKGTLAFLMLHEMREGQEGLSPTPFVTYSHF